MVGPSSRGALVVEERRSRIAHAGDASSTSSAGQRDAAPLLEPAERPLDDVATSVAAGSDSGGHPPEHRQRPARRIDGGVRLGRHRSGPLSAAATVTDRCTPGSPGSMWRPRRCDHRHPGVRILGTASGVASLAGAQLLVETAHTTGRDIALRQAPCPWRRQGAVHDPAGSGWTCWTRSSPPPSGTRWSLPSDDCRPSAHPADPPPPTSARDPSITGLDAPPPGRQPAPPPAPKPNPGQTTRAQPTRQTQPKITKS